MQTNQLRKRRYHESRKYSDQFVFCVHLIRRSDLLLVVVSLKNLFIHALSIYCTRTLRLLKTLPLPRGEHQFQVSLDVNYTESAIYLLKSQAVGLFDLKGFVIRSKHSEFQKFKESRLKLLGSRGQLAAAALKSINIYNLKHIGTHLYGTTNCAFEINTIEFLADSQLLLTNLDKDLEGSTNSAFYFALVDLDKVRVTSSFKLDLNSGIESINRLSQRTKLIPRLFLGIDETNEHVFLSATYSDSKKKERNSIIKMKLQNDSLLMLKQYNIPESLVIEFSIFKLILGEQTNKWCLLLQDGFDQGYKLMVPTLANYSEPDFLFLNVAKYTRLVLLKETYAHEYKLLQLNEQKISVVGLLQ